MEQLPKCPKCHTNNFVEFVKGCRCGSCPPYICKVCLPYKNAEYQGYEFFDDDETDTNPE